MWFRQDLRLHDNPALFAACMAPERSPAPHANAASAYAAAAAAAATAASAATVAGAGGAGAEVGLRAPMRRRVVIPLFILPPEDEEGGWPMGGACRLWLHKVMDG